MERIQGTEISNSVSTQENFCKYLQVDKARGMVRELACYVAETEKKKNFCGVSRQLLPTRVLICAHACHFPPQHVNLFNKL